MSRVEDDRNEQRIAQQKMLQRQQDEAKTRDRKTTDSAFAQKLSQSHGEKSIGQQKTAESKQGAASAYESLLDSMSSAEQAQHTKDGGKETLGRSVLKQATSEFQHKLQNSRAGDGERMSESRNASGEANAQSSSSRASDARGAEHTSEGRASDARSTREEQNKTGKSDSAGAGGATAGREDKLKTGADGGGGKGAGGDSGQGGQDMGAGFRFNPALMAPVPVAKARDNSASERIRRVAQEIAQKIVENVRIGTNASGAAEFQIDLRSNVMSGLSIKVSGGNGRISATFSGSDREVLKLLEENKENLEKALSGRGLQLAELKIEAKA